MTQLGTKKSRGGCKRCKTRRVKCDEQAPCANCVRRSEECSLLEPSPSGSDAPLDPALPTNADEWVDDLALLHHYTINTALETRGMRPVLHVLWRDYVPQQATKHKFLMHGILALSALHLAYLKPEEASKYARLSDKHQAIALAKYRSILASDIDMESADALFAFAATINLTTMARSCSPIMNDFVDKIDIDSTLEVFYLTRGSRDIIALCGRHIHNGPMSEMLSGHLMDSGDDTVVILPSSVIARFQEVRTLLLGFKFHDRASLEACQEALEYLETMYKNITYFAKNSAIHVGQVWYWTTQVSPGFLKLVQERNPAALVIIAYFAAASMAIQTAWYTENWGTLSLRGIAAELDPEYHSYLEWPFEHGNRHMDILGVLVQDDDRSRPLIGY